MIHFGTMAFLYVLELPQNILQNIKKLHIALLEAKTEVFVRPVRVMNEDFDLDILFHA